MTIVIFTLVEHKYVNGKYYGYAPYIFEMNMWTRHFDKVIVVGHFSPSQQLDAIDAPYTHSHIDLVPVPRFHIKSLSAILRLTAQLPSLFYTFFKVMRRADYLHFRCPSNVAALAAIVQVFFPKLPKSTKYAGNWNPQDKQPPGYRFQKWLLAHRRLTKNMRVLVYGDYPNQPKAVQPFISATYNADEKLDFVPRDYSKVLKFVFIGAMVVGKRPFLTIDIIKGLCCQDYKAELHMFGDGPLMKDVVTYVEEQGLKERIKIYGNKDKAAVKQCLKDAHFTILPSKSEGWPKAIAEGMFFGAIPISTKISCLPWMLDYGHRGILIDADVQEAVSRIVEVLEQGSKALNAMAKRAMLWSQQYTIDRLEQEIAAVVDKGFEYSEKKA